MRVWPLILATIVVTVVCVIPGLYGLFLLLTGRAAWHPTSWLLFLFVGLSIAYVVWNLELLKELREARKSFEADLAETKVAFQGFDDEVATTKRNEAA